MNDCHKALYNRLQNSRVDTPTLNFFHFNSPPFLSQSLKNIEVNFFHFIPPSASFIYLLSVSVCPYQSHCNLLSQHWVSFFIWLLQRTGRHGTARNALTAMVITSKKLLLGNLLWVELETLKLKSWKQKYIWIWEQISNTL